MISLEGQVAIITGASRGIGRAIAIKLAELGAKIVVSSSSKGSDAVAEEINAMGKEAISIQANVAEEGDALNLVNVVVKHFGKIDILVNNAGITKDGLMMRMSEDDWQSVLDVNLKGVFLCMKAALKHLAKQRSGKIINISSIIGLIGNPGQANYAASKAGIIAMTKSIAQEVGSRNINVNAIAPGFIDTDMTRELPDKLKDELLNKIALKRFGNTDDVASLTAFLASDQSNYITGQVFVVDGGLTMSG